MKQVIQISSESSFNKGIISYLVECNIHSGGLHISPDIKIAKDLSNDTPESISKTFEFMKRNFKHAKVELVKL